MFDCYDPAYNDVIKRVALEQNIPLHEGVYCAINGPVFFTKAELRMLMKLGADSIGMSTVPEVIVAIHRGMKAAGIAVISDIAIPDSGHHATEQEVIATAQKTGPLLSASVGEGSGSFLVALPKLVRPSIKAIWRP